jgi:hypothetical protein
MCPDKLVYLCEQVICLIWFDHVFISTDGKRVQIVWEGRCRTKQSRGVQVEGSDFIAKLGASCFPKSIIDYNQVPITVLG